MARPKRKNDNTEENKESPFVLGDNFVPKMTTDRSSIIGEQSNLDQYYLPEWSKTISEQLISQANLKGSPGFDPGFEQAKQVEQMTALGMSSTDIAAVLRIEPKLLTKFYDYEINTASHRINQAVAKIALQQALSGNSDMTKFWLKTRAGWKETKTTELVGANGGPIAFSEVKQKMLNLIEAEITDVTFEDKEED